MTAYFGFVMRGSWLITVAYVAYADRPSMSSETDEKPSSDLLLVNFDAATAAESVGIAAKQFIQDVVSAVAPDRDLLAGDSNQTSPDGSLADWWIAKNKLQGETSILDDVASALGDNNSGVSFKALLPKIQTELGPLYASIPKNKNNLLGHTAVRYMLHRFFMRRYAWFVHGLRAGSGGEKWQNSSLTELFMNNVPLKASRAFEERLSGRGFDLNDSAILATAIEYIIFEAAVKDLRDTYASLDMSTRDVLNVSTVDLVLNTFLAIRMLKSIGHPMDLHPNRHLFDVLGPTVAYSYPRWEETMVFLSGLRKRIEPLKVEFDFEDVARIVREAEGSWARWASDYECKNQKKILLQIEEHRGSGCVRLADFYERSMQPPDGWMFKESPEYLSKEGALEVSDKTIPRVLVANYVNAPGNCRTTLKHYMACCVSECEALQDQVEQKVQGKGALPEEILAVIRPLTAKAEPPYESISDGLVYRLEEIAERHNGLVPLQSRLFSQWMHFVFPNECPFPHTAGTNDVHVVAVTDEDMLVDEALAKSYVLSKKYIRGRRKEQCMTWEADEELFVPTYRPTLQELETEPELWIAVYAVAALASFSLMIAKTFMSITRRPKTKLAGLV